MARGFMNGPLRFVVYAIVIAAFVAGGLSVLLIEQPLRPNFAGSDALRALPPPWKSTLQALAEANQDFSVASTADNNQPQAGRAIGSNWPQFNGLRRDNRSDETGLLETWPEGGPPLSWSAHGLGAGYSSVAVVDGVAYTMGNKGSSEVVMALDVGTGEKIWSTPFARSTNLSMGAGPRGTPTVSEGLIYGLGAEGELVCLDATTGGIRWQLNILKEYAAPNIGWGISESVFIDGDQLICTPGGKKATLVALNKRTGKQIWKSIIDQESASYASPVVTEVDGLRQYVQFFAGGTAGLRASDGQLLWRNSRSSSGTANCSSPLIADRYVFSAAGYGTGGTLLKLSGNQKSTSAELVYHTPDMKNHHGDMVIVDGLLYGSDDPGILICLGLETGAVKWKDRTIGKGSVTYAEGRIYLRGEKNEVALVAATGDEYRELGRFEQPERSSEQAWSHPVVAHGRLFLRDQSLLLCYDLRRNP